MELPPLTRIRGVHRNSSLYHNNDGYFYTCSKQAGNSFYFRCSKSGSRCPATAVLRSGCFVSSLHNHPPDFLHETIQLERERIVNQAANLQYATFNEIFHDTRNSYPGILTPHSLQPAMARIRTEALPREPNNLHDLDNILRDGRYKCLTATRGFDDNIYAGSTSSDDCFVILLLSRECKEFLKLSIALYGFTSLFTLQGAPLQYGVHVIYTVWDGTIIFLAWMLMDHVSERSFVSGLTLLKSALGRSHFTTVFCRYASVEVNAYKQVFPSVKVTVSLHHLVEAVCDFINFKNLNHPHLLHAASLCCVLPILPQDSFVIGMQVIREEVARYNGLQEPTQSILNFVASKFLSSAFTHNTSMSGDYYSTSNINETVQTKVLRTIEVHKNSVYSFLRAITSTAAITKNDILDIKSGRRRRRRCATSIINESEIQVMMKGLINPFGNEATAARNLLLATSHKIKHLLLNRF